MISSSRRRLTLGPWHRWIVLHIPVCVLPCAYCRGNGVFINTCVALALFALLYLPYTNSNTGHV